jgi:hypothetical protein
MLIQASCKSNFIIVHIVFPFDIKQTVKQFFISTYRRTQYALVYSDIGGVLVVLQGIHSYASVIVSSSAWFWHCYHVLFVNMLSVTFIYIIIFVLPVTEYYSKQNFPQ